MSSNYRSLFEVPAETDPLALAFSHFRQWLKTKRDDDRSLVKECDWDGPGSHAIGDATYVTETRVDEQDGSHILRLTFDETNNAGRWVTRVTAAERPRKDAWSRFLWVETSAENSDADRTARDPVPPRLIRSLLDEVEGRNGLARISTRPSVVRLDHEEVDGLFDAIVDPSRFVPLIVAGGVENGPWYVTWFDAITDLTYPGVGMQSVVVLEADARAELNARLGPWHEIPTGGVRTYLPGARLKERADGIRHRFITPETLADAIVGHRGEQVRVRPSLARAMAWNSRRTVLAAGLPTRVRRVDQIIRRKVTHDRATAEPRDPIYARITGDGVPKAGEPAASTAPHATTVDASLELLRVMVGELFEVDIVTTEHVVNFGQLISAMAKDLPTLEAESAAAEKLLEDALDEYEQVRAQANDMTARLDDAELELAMVEEGRRDIEREVVWLRKQLIDSQRFDALVIPDEPTAPKDLADLLDRLLKPDHVDRHRTFDHVVFTGDRDVTEVLLAYDTVGRIAARTWDVLIALGDYVEAKIAGETTHLFGYLKEPPPGRRVVPMGWFASDESETVKQRNGWRAERTFSVPVSIDPSGWAFMSTHFRLGGGDKVSPRLYLHDAVDVDGKIYVGYIGRHLSNTQS